MSRVVTNLLLLYVVGLTSPENVPRHKRLGAFKPEHFVRLAVFLSGRRLVLTPNVVTETSNLLRTGPGTPIVQAAMKQLVKLLEIFGEIYVPSLEASAHPAAEEQGITDAVTLIVAREQTILATVDRALAAEASRAKVAVFNVLDAFAYRA